MLGRQKMSRPAPAEDGLFADAWVALRRFKHGETRRDHRDRVWVFGPASEAAGRSSSGAPQWPFGMLQVYPYTSKIYHRGLNLND